MEESKKEKTEMWGRCFCHEECPFVTHDKRSVPSKLNIDGNLNRVSAYAYESKKPVLTLWGITAIGIAEGSFYGLKAFFT